MSPTENPDAASKPSLYLQDMAEVEKVFQRFDSNGDGRISAVELTSVLKALGSDGSQEEVSRMMDEIDSDKDGYINLEEFANFCKTETLAADGGNEELREAFEMYDQNHNGLISAAELHQILTKLGEHCTVQSCQKMIASVDSDGDGSVSFEEFKHMMSKNKK